MILFMRNKFSMKSAAIIAARVGEKRTNKEIMDIAMNQSAIDDNCDSSDMWQIGVDVLPEYRRKGIASASIRNMYQLSENRFSKRVSKTPIIYIVYKEESTWSF